MATFAGALGRGLAGYAANRERADARDADLAQQQRAEARQAERDKQADTMMAAQLEAMRVAAARNAAEDTRRGEMDRNAALDDGLRDTEPTRQMGTLMSGAANVGVGSTGAALGALGGCGRAARAAAESPTQYSVGGKPMVKAAESLAERTARMAVEQRRGERMADAERDTARDDKNFAQQKELAKFTRSLQPRPERQPVTQVGNDGNMYFSEDGGRTWNQSRMAGAGAGPSPDRPMPTEVPTQRPALADSLPGSGFSRSFTAPQAQGAPTGGSSPQQPAQPPRGVFGKAQDGGGMGDAERKSFNEAEVASRQLVTMLNQYKEALAQNGTAWTDGGDPKRNAMSSLQRQILALYKGPAFANLGVLAGPDMELLDQIVSPATGMMAKVKGTEGITAQINEVLQNAEMTRAARHEVLGVPYKPISAPQSTRPPLSAIMGVIR